MLFYCKIKLQQILMIVQVDQICITDLLHEKLTQISIYIIMKRGVTQRPPQVASDYNIGLVKYENPDRRDIFDLTTVHSLLIDQNDKFRKLKQLVSDYNKKQLNKNLARPTFDRKFIQKLYKMLCQVVRIGISENQLIYLNQIYSWAFRVQEEQDDLDFQNFSKFNPSNNQNGEGKMRPNTASTKSRPYSAHTRKTRPDSGVPQTKYSIAATKKSTEDDFISEQVIEKYPNVDFKKLKSGQRQFFQGHRTIHTQLERPKIRLKQYHRKVLYNQNDDEDDDFKEFIEEEEQIPQPVQKKKETGIKNLLPPSLQQEEQKKKEELKQILANKEVPIQNQQNQPLDGQQNKEQQNVEGAAIEGVGQQDVNIDDLLIDQQGVAEEDQQEVVDKLKPKVKPYQGDPKQISRKNKQKIFRRLQDDKNNRQQFIRNIIEDNQEGQRMMKQWAAIKGQVKIEQKRRSQSARLINKHPGITYDKQKKQNIGEVAQETTQVVDFSQQKVCQTKITTRPKTAFKPESRRVFEQQIKNAMISGNLGSHISLPVGLTEEQKIQLIQQNKAKKMQYNNWLGQNQRQRIVSVGSKPKKKTFQEILSQAHDRVVVETQNQIDIIKQKLTTNKISLGANRIAKSLTYHVPQIEEGDFVGQVTGKNMLNNPFFKVAKKKKKKKKKK